jgi:hypothetical protein
MRNRERHGPRRGSERRTARALAIALALQATGLAATDIHVVTTAWGNDLDGFCSLQEALTAAINNSPAYDCPAGSADLDRILLDVVGTYSVIDTLEATIGPTAGPLSIEGPTTDPADAQIVGGGTLVHRFLSLQGADPVTLERLSLVSIHDEGGPGGVIEAVDSELTLRSMVIENCGAESGAGGAIAALDTDLTLRSVVIENCSADDGGALAFTTSPGISRQLRIEDSRMAANRADGARGLGGGLYVSVGAASEVRIAGSSFFENHAEPSAVEPGQGGGLFLEATDLATVEIVESEFVGNSASTTALFISGAGASLDLSGTAQALLAGLTFETNQGILLEPTSSGQISGLVVLLKDAAGLSLTRTRLLDNTSNQGADQQLVVALDLFSTGPAEVTDLLIVGGFRAANLSSSGSGPLRVSHVTATENVRGLSLDRTWTGTVGLYNTIAWNNADFDLEIFGDVEQLSNLIGVDPEFEDAATGDYRPQAGSPAIEGGDSSLPGQGFLDCGHGPRLVGGETDLGAFEFGGIFADDFEVGGTWGWSASIEP